MIGAAPDIVCQGEAYMLVDGKEVPVATMLATLMTIQDRPDVKKMN